VPAWAPYVGCGLVGLVYGVVCTMLVHGERELGRLRAEVWGAARDELGRGVQNECTPRRCPCRPLPPGDGNRTIDGPLWEHKTPANEGFL